MLKLATYINNKAQLDNKQLFQEVWQSSRWLFLIMFGIPTAVISVVCYSLCCMETVDDEYQSDDEDSDEEYRALVKSKLEISKQSSCEK